MKSLTGYAIFATLITLLLVSWSLVTFWQRFLENLAYQTFGLNPDDTWVSLLLAVATTSIFLMIVWVIKYIGLIPDLDNMIYDYKPEDVDQFNTVQGGPTGKTRKPRAKTIGKKYSPRGALPTLLNPSPI